MALKLQIWSLDLIFAVVIFSFTITVVGVTWLHISNGLTTSYSNSQGILYMQASAMSDTLLSAGSPADWQVAANTINSASWNGLVPGIEKAPGQPQISQAKLYTLMSMVSSNYSATRSLFGVGSDYYIVISGAGPGISNITLGKNPLIYNASTIFVNKRSAVLNGNPVVIQVEVWSNSTATAG
ncbi:MAG: hypothetical protein KGH94_02035 [Candidatus Micrarchaeota archaeon]|nr:hypothetical protein [Candidatus Micrarchaeota archaeon]